jgi:hypothetical protein
MVAIPVRPMFHPGQEFPFRGTIAPQRVGDDHPGHVRQAFEAFATTLLGSLLVSLPLHEHIEDMAILIDRPPPIVAFAMDGQQDFIQVPRVPRSGSAVTQPIGIGVPKRPAPIPPRLISQADAACGHQLFDIPRAQAQAAIPPDAMADELRREALGRIQVGCGWSVHAARMARGTGAGQGGRFI